MRILWGIFLLSAGLNVALLLRGPESSVPTAKASVPQDSRKSHRRPAGLSLSPAVERLEQQLAEARKAQPTPTSDPDLIPENWVGIRASFADLSHAFWQDEVRLTSRIAKHYKLTPKERGTLDEEARKLFRSTVQSAELRNASFKNGEDGEAIAVLPAEPRALAEFLTQYATFAIQFLGEKRGHLFAQHVLAGQGKWQVERSHGRIIHRIPAAIAGSDDVREAFLEFATQTIGKERAAIVPHLLAHDPYLRFDDGVVEITLVNDGRTLDREVTVILSDGTRQTERRRDVEYGRYMKLLRDEQVEAVQDIIRNQERDRQERGKKNK